MKRSCTTGAGFVFFFKCPSNNKIHNSVRQKSLFHENVRYLVKCINYFLLLFTFSTICKLSRNNKMVTNTFYGLTYQVWITPFSLKSLQSCHSIE